MEIRKEAGVMTGGVPDEKQLEKINRQAKKTLQAEDVYVFSVRLCDDQVDRDYERFTPEAIEKLAELFVGKTGISDHAWSAERQVARIFDTGVEYENGVMYLKAWAYMMRSEKNEALIGEIEGGIKKEVSVGCAVGKSICSICGKDYGSCEHRKGAVYGGEVCTANLCEPVDAYEFSFVAVPAQKEAGVMKGFGGAAAEAELKKLEKEAAAGRLYRKELADGFVRAGLVLELGLSEEVLRGMAETLDTETLRQAEKALAEKTEELFPPVCQLSMGQNCVPDENGAFLI